MSDTFTALQAALYTYLSTDPALQTLCGSPLRLYDVPPTNAVFPYLAFTGLEGRDASTKTTTAHNVIVSLATFSREPGFKQNEQLLATLRHRLHDASLTLSTGHLARCQVEFFALTREPDGLTSRGQLRLRTLITAT